MVYIGLDFGGTSIKVGLVDEGGHILSQGSVPTGMPRPYQPMIADTARLALELLEDEGLRLEDVHSIGAGVPGIAIQETGLVPFCPNLSWHEVPFRVEMQKYIDKPVFIDNDANAAAMAEALVGVSAGVDNSVLLTLGTGLGAGIILNNRPYSGSHHIGGELGHFIIKMDGEPCTCGNRGCYERYATATALIREGKKAIAAHPNTLMLEYCDGDPEILNAKMVVDAAKAADPAAMQVFDDYVKALCTGMLTVINFIDPQMIVLGGGVSLAGDFLLDAVRAHLAPMIFAKTMPYASVELATLGNDAGIIGAALLGTVL